MNPHQDKSKNWRDIFSFVRSKSFFLKLSSFWTHWAERFELDGCIKQADAILEQGEYMLLTTICNSFCKASHIYRMIQTN